jgi:SpoVK/Ycf46/Vps4 family AAA+-type ATPase
MFGKNKIEDNFKFKSLQVFAWDRSVGIKKKFRKLFEKAELNYLSVEISVFNKQFDEKDWESDIRLVAFKLLSNGTRKEICEKKETITINKEENIYSYSYGWGSDTRGNFWEKGTYEWEAYMDGNFVSTAKFYIEELGVVKTDINPYLSVASLKTYESPTGDLDDNDRRYLKAFDVSSTRYIMGEMKFKNLVSQEWHCELFFNIYDDTGMHIGTSDLFFVVTPDDGTGEEFTVTAGWGGKDSGTWIDDNYTMEVVFMDTVIAVIPFTIGNKEIERLSDYEALLNEDVGSIYNDTIEVKKSNAELDSKKSDKDELHGDNEDDSEESEEDVEVYIDEKPLEEILDELNSLTGLENIKKKVREYIDYVSFLQFREESGIEEKEEVVLHSVFTGNPGTGKTTVVKLLGDIFRAMGLLSKGHVHSVEANDLISGYIRQSGKDTKKAIKAAKGGILFIDEAYMLFKEGANNDFGPEAVAALITEMSDGDGDIAIMVAGYPKEMEQFIESNPGLKSRFRNHFHFEDYTPDELFEISQFASKKKGVEISKGAETQLKKVLTEAFRKRDRTFGNARYANALIDEAKINLGIRIMKDPNIEEITKSQLSTLMADDIEDISNPAIEKKLNLKIDENLLKEALSELNQLTGLTNIKREVQELVKLSRYYNEIGRDILKAFSMHSVFMGNPGTGKTTVARIIAKIYKALGMLERGHLIDADGSDLVAGFVGQTSIKTKELIKQAMGGILFIDEAYAITEGSHSGFGSKAIAAIIKEMEDHRSEFGLIVAGYTKNMEDFLETNPGLKSRFDQNFVFADFSEIELWEITLNMYTTLGLIPSEEAAVHLKNYIKHLYENRDRFFGNARSIRKIVEKSHRNQELRMADIPKKSRTEGIMKTLSIDDVKEFIPDMEKSTQRQPLGFKFN